MPQGESHVLRSQILLLCNGICHLSRFAERSQKVKKKKETIITPRVELGPPVIKSVSCMVPALCTLIIMLDICVILQVVWIVGGF